MIPVNSTNVSAREHPFFMPQISNLPHGKTGIVWPDVGGGLTDRVRYRLTGGIYTYGKISNIVEKGYGIYAYRHDQVDTVTKGFIYLDADDPDCQSWTGQEQIAAQLGGILVGETDDVERELAFHLPNSVNPMVPTVGQVFSTGQVQLYLPGGSGWVNADITRIVEKGEGDYALRLTDAQVALAGKIYLYVNCPGSQPWTWWYDIVTPGLGAGAIELISITQPPLQRWQPVVAVIRVSGAAVFIKYITHMLYLGIYDPTLGFSSNFKERSSVQTSGDILTFTILPNGGWWRNRVSFKFAAGAELTV